MKKTLPVRIGSLVIGGGAPIAVQSMTKTPTTDVVATVRQIRRLEKMGCELVRVAVPDHRAAAVLPEIRKRVKLPLCADIHFDHRLALAALAAGFDKIRINPGNIGSPARVKEVIQAAADRGAAIRIGVNSGSLEKKIFRRYGHPTPQALCDSLERSLEPFARAGFTSLVLSAKTTSVQDTITTYRELFRRFPYPLHLGLTEAGLPFEGSIRSVAALAPLLLAGIGDTLRISLTGDPALEVVAAWELLAALGLRQKNPLIYSCPTCGRTRTDMVNLTRKVKKAIARLRLGEPGVKIAVMGCVVNGPGEAREADFGIACGRNRGAVFCRGQVVGTYPEKKLVEKLVEVILASQPGKSSATPSAPLRHPVNNEG